MKLGRDARGIERLGMPKCMLGTARPSCGRLTPANSGKSMLGQVRSGKARLSVWSRSGNVKAGSWAVGREKSGNVGQFSAGYCDCIRLKRVDSEMPGKLQSGKAIALAPAPRFGQLSDGN